MLSFGKEPGATASQQFFDGAASGYDCLQLLSGNLCFLCALCPCTIKKPLNHSANEKHLISYKLKWQYFEDKIALNGSFTRYSENLKTFCESCRNQLDHLFWVILSHTDMMDAVQVKHWQPRHRAMDGWKEIPKRSYFWIQSLLLGLTRSYLQICSWKL